jgi:hypothetical protein
MNKETIVFEGYADWGRNAYLLLKDNKVIFDCSDEEYGPVEFDISLLIKALKNHTTPPSKTNPKDLPEQW